MANTDTCKIGYIRNKFNNPIATIAYTISREKDEIKYAYAVCSNNDNFNKRVGRDKACGRLRSDKYCATIKLNDANSTVALTRIFDAILPLLSSDTDLHIKLPKLRH